MVGLPRGVIETQIVGNIGSARGLTNGHSALKVRATEVIAMSGARFAIFLSVVLAVWAVMHLYVFWRLTSVPWVVEHFSKRTILLTGCLLWLSYPLARILESNRLDVIGIPLEFLASLWLGTLFLLFAAVLVTDLVTVGGLLLPRLTPRITGWAALTALVFTLVAFVQGLRAPVVREYEVAMPGLPKERDGMVVVQISDLHLGTQIGRGWLEKLVAQVESLQPDLLVVVGDVIDGNVSRVAPFVPVLKKFNAPLGVWAVTGNHEFYAGLEPSVALLESAGFKMLRGASAEVAPGLVLAGVDDLTAQEQAGLGAGGLNQALTNRPPGATILLSHTPKRLAPEETGGVNLMLSGHTHNGQIWPFNYLVKLRYPWVGGRYQAGDTTVIVCRGTATWGPRMRLWRPNELVRITLRSTPGASPVLSPSLASEKSS